jgi:hypothetical protein
MGKINLTRLIEKSGIAEEVAKILICSSIWCHQGFMDNHGYVNKLCCFDPL